MTNYIEMSQYYSDDRTKRADVVRNVGDPNNRVYGVRFNINEHNLGIEWYEGKSESWAESAAENWVMGIKETPNF